MKKKKDAILYVTLLILSVLFIIIGNRWAVKDAVMFQGLTGQYTDRHFVRVDAILSQDETDTVIDGKIFMTDTKIKFSSTIVWGDHKGETLIVTQTYDTLTSRLPTPVRVGDKLFAYLNANVSSDYFAGEFVRIDLLAVVACVFFLLLILFGRLKGLATIVALSLSVLSIFLVFIPSILSGHNVYLSAIIICLYSIVITPFLIGGFNLKSISAAFGSIGGVAVAGVITAFLNSALRITGVVDEETMQVAFILSEPIDLRAITFAAILIGALGACLDVSMSIASSICEMREASGRSDFKSLLNSGMNIGRDIMGTQTSTLVLAYIGGSMSIVLLLVAYQSSVLEMLNLEIVIIELLQALIGGFTILFTIPATAIVSALMFSQGNKEGGETEQDEPKQRPEHNKTKRAAKSQDKTVFRIGS